MTSALPPIRWGILGTGRVARLFGEALKTLPGSTLAAVASRDAERGRDFAAGLSVGEHHGSYEALAADQSIDVIYIATPHPFHLEHALLCLNHGRHVVVEKPIALDADEARTLFATAKSKQRFCMEAMWTRFAPPFISLKQQLAKNRIGKCQTFEATLGFQHPFDPTDRLFDKALGGGVTLDLVTYPVSLLVSLFGPPNQLSATAQMGTTGVDEIVELSLGFAGDTNGDTNGTINGTVRCSFRETLENRLILNGTNGTMSVAPLYMPTSLAINSPNDLTGAGLMSRAWRKLNRTMFSTPKPTLQGYQFEAHQAAQCIHAGLLESATMPHAESILVMEILDQIRDQIQSIDR